MLIDQCFVLISSSLISNCDGKKWKIPKKLGSIRPNLLLPKCVPLALCPYSTLPIDQNQPSEFSTKRHQLPSSHAESTHAAEQFFLESQWVSCRCSLQFLTHNAQESQFRGTSHSTAESPRNRRAGVEKKPSVRVASTSLSPKVLTYRRPFCYISVFPGSLCICFIVPTHPILQDPPATCFTCQNSPLRLLDRSAKNHSLSIRVWLKQNHPQPLQAFQTQFWIINLGPKKLRQALAFQAASQPICWAARMTSAKPSAGQSPSGHRSNGGLCGETSGIMEIISDNIM